MRATESFAALADDCLLSGLGARYCRMHCATASRASCVFCSSVRLKNVSDGVAKLRTPYCNRTFNYMDAPVKDLSGFQICCFIWIPELIVGERIIEFTFVRFNQSINFPAERQVPVARIVTARHGIIWIPDNRIIWTKAGRGWHSQYGCVAQRQDDSSCVCDIVRSIHSSSRAEDEASCACGTQPRVVGPPCGWCVLQDKPGRLQRDFA